MLIDLTLRNFAESVAAKTSTPGGGSVSAYAAALGASLGIMAARYSEGAAAAEAAQALEGLKDRFIGLVDRDTEAYSKVSSAYGLPKKTDEEKAKRRATIQAALVEAAEVPLQAMRSSVEALEALTRLSPICNRNLSSDLAGAMLLLKAGLEGCSWNVRINAAGVTDSTRRSSLEVECGELLTKGRRHAETVMLDAGRLAGKS